MFKVLFPTLLFFSAICSAQTYHFDYSVSYHSATNQNNKRKTSNIYKNLEPV
ncbi:hypothetical protein SAMN05421847_0518 [Halpernia humi]|uniref:Uncharacterized protein n=1 Tax=Halpernia humi TaxID=493375 RepID=A0A1H5TM17_9FLAO|nr:hypothetical protein SAMN05421847_0518 [Halpernia humi]